MYEVSQAMSQPISAALFFRAAPGCVIYILPASPLSPPTASPEILKSNVPFLLPSPLCLGSASSPATAIKSHI